MDENKNINILFEEWKFHEGEVSKWVFIFGWLIRLKKDECVNNTLLLHTGLESQVTAIMVSTHNICNISMLNTFFAQYLQGCKGRQFTAWFQAKSFVMYGYDQVQCLRIGTNEQKFMRT